MTPAQKGTAQPQEGGVAEWAKPMRKIRGDHDYTLDGPWRGKKCVTQSMYLRMGEYVVAIGELNRPNHWRDEEIDAFAKALQAVWNESLRRGIEIGGAQ